MLCLSRDDVLEEGVNVWAGEETPTFKPKADIVLIHGLGSHPYWAWLQDPSLKVGRASSSPFQSSDSTASLLLPRSGIYSIHENAEDIGLLSSPDLSWTNDYSQRDIFGNIGTFWPRDLLASDVTDVRICTVGYKSQWASSRFSTNFQECGDHVLTVLEHSRQSKQARRRPIVFIAHSFGGLVVQSALITATLEARFANIAESVAGCLFLGTPFQGTNAVSLLSMATSLSGNSQDILDSLKPGNLDLQLLQDQFRNIYPHVPSVCFYETIKSGLRRSLMIVSKDAACLPRAKHIALHKDHSGLNKFGSHTDESYMLILAELKDMLKSVHCTHRVGPSRRRRHSNGEQIRGHFRNLVPDRLKAVVKPKTEGLFSESFEFLVRHAPRDSGHLRDFAFHRFPGRPSLDDPYGLAREQYLLETPAPQHFNETSKRPELGHPIQSSQPCGFHRLSVQGFGVGQVREPRRRPPNPNRSPSHRKQLLNDAQYSRMRESDFERVKARSDKYTADMSHSQNQKLAGQVEDSPLTTLPPHLRKSFSILQSQLLLSEEKAPKANTPVSQTSEIPGRWPPETTFESPDIVGRVVELEAASSYSPRQYLEPSGTEATGILEGRRSDSISHLVREASPDLTSKCATSSPLRYLKHVEQSIAEYCDASAHASRGDLLDQLALLDQSPTARSRVALSGPLGIGKTYVALACVCRLMIQRPSIPIFWIAADLDSQIQEDCIALTELLSLSRPEDNATSSELLLKVLTDLRASILGPWLLVLDGLNENMTSDLEIQRLREICTGQQACVLITTRRLDVARKFTHGDGLTVAVGSLDPAYAANLLASEASAPSAYVYDEVAACLEFNPSAVKRAETFIRMTGMPADEFSGQLTAMIDESYWRRQGANAMELGRTDSHVQRSLVAGHSVRDAKLTFLAPVVRSCLNPAWLLIFDRLYEEHPAACELLSSLSAFGRTSIPRIFLSSNAAVRAAGEVLLNHSYFSIQENVMRISRLMLLSHRIWLIAREGLGPAFRSALQMVASEYPDANDPSIWHICQELEPFANYITSETAKSWIELDNSSRWFRTMLFQKRSKFFKLSGINAWQSKEMDDAELVELSAIHKPAAQSSD